MLLRYDSDTCVIQLTQIIADKEKKSSSYKENKLDSLSEEKTTKIKKFAKEYIAKIMRKLEKSGQAKRRSSHSNGSGKDKDQAPANGKGQLPTPATTVTPDSPGADVGGEQEISLSAVFDDDEMDVAEEDVAEPEEDMEIDNGADMPQRTDEDGLHGLRHDARAVAMAVS
jgi:[histone H3]-lysine36 N-trimethyltransferase